MNLREHIEEIISEPTETTKLIFYIREYQIKQAEKILIEMNLNYKIIPDGFYTKVQIDFGFCQKEIIHHAGL